MTLLQFQSLLAEFGNLKCCCSPGCRPWPQEAVKAADLEGLLWHARLKAPSEVDEKSPSVLSQRCPGLASGRARIQLGTRVAHYKACSFSSRSNWVPSGEACLSRRCCQMRRHLCFHLCLFRPRPASGRSWKGLSIASSAGAKSRVLYSCQRWFMLRMSSWFVTRSAAFSRSLTFDYCHRAL